MFTQPNFFFIGGMRCGSTSLNLMLEQHPEIYMSGVKEPHYYLAQAFRNKETPSPEDTEFLETFVKGGKYRTAHTYQSLFQDIGGAKVVGESSHYLYYGETAAAIYKDSPDARILVCLRNPVDRLFSEYLLFLRDGRETGNFADFIERYAADFINQKTRDKMKIPKLDKGLQAELLKPWFKQFGRERVKTVLFDDLNQHPVETMKDIFSWLEVDADFTAQKIHAQKGGAAKAKWMTKAMNSQTGILKRVKGLVPKTIKVKLRSAVFSRTLERPEMEPETRRFLVEFYQDDVEQLSKIIRKDLTCWT